MPAQQSSERTLDRNAPPLEVASLTAHDVERARAVACSSFASPTERPTFGDELRHPTTRALVARLNGHVLGYLVGTIVSDEAEVVSLAVDPGQRRRGAAGALLDAFIDGAVRDGVRTVFLEVRRSNRAAIALYESRGFRRTGTRARYYADGEDAASYRLDLGLTI